VTAGGADVHVRLEPPAASGDDAGVLARIRFRPAGEEADVPLPLLASDGIDEVWRSSRAVAGGRIGDIAWRGNEDVVFARLTRPDDDIEAATFAAYNDLFVALDGLGDFRVIRLWNYFSMIHGAGGDADRYGLFCRGRYEALRPRLADFERRLPAASAIGSRVPGLTLLALATRGGFNQIENPRQISAFRYPPAYAPRSPSFSRSVLATGGDGVRRLLVSGTASIVGHRSRHAGDFSAQLAETLANLARLLDAGGEAAGRPLRFRLLRVYLRREAAVDPGEVAAAIRARLGADCAMVLLAGDICRPDLLVEIEGIAEVLP
jgi:chorismate lyase/3-hydroxybenzoate synthase